MLRIILFTAFLESLDMCRSIERNKSVGILHGNKSMFVWARIIGKAQNHIPSERLCLSLFGFEWSGKELSRGKAWEAVLLEQWKWALSQGKFFLIILGAAIYIAISLLFATYTADKLDLRLESLVITCRYGYCCGSSNLQDHVLNEYMLGQKQSDGEFETCVCSLSHLHYAERPNEMRATKTDVEEIASRKGMVCFIG